MSVVVVVIGFIWVFFMCIHEGFNSFEICGEDLNDICGDVSCLRQCVHAC